MQRKLRASIIGTGRIAGLLQEDPLRHGVVTHLGAYRALPQQVTVVACASRKEEHAKLFAEKFAIPAYYGDYQLMLQQEKPDLVSICAYTESRLEMVQAAVQAGVKGIFCEKPLASGLAEADTIVALCRRNRVLLSVNHTRRWEEAYHYARELIQKNILGKVLHVSGFCSGALFHTGTHLFDVLHFFFGRAQSVAGRLATKGVITPRRKNEAMPFAHEDYDGIAWIRFKKNIEACVFGLRRDYFIFELDIQGSEGRLRIGNHLFEVFRAKKSDHYTGFQELQRIPLQPEPHMPSALLRAVEELVLGITRKSKGKPRLTSNGEAARDALEIGFGILESHRKGGREILIPLKRRKARVVAR